MSAAVVHPRTVQVISKGGLANSRDCAIVSAAVIEDLITGAMQPQVANAVSNAMGKMLRIFEMEHKYGTTTKGETPKSLQLVRRA